MATSVVGTTVTDAAIGATLGLAPDSEPQTLEVVPEDVVEDSD
jgi:hypothetical protein